MNATPRGYPGLEPAAAKMRFAGKVPFGRREDLRPPSMCGAPVTLRCGSAIIEARYGDGCGWSRAPTAKEPSHFRSLDFSGAAMSRLLLPGWCWDFSPTCQGTCKAN